MPTYSANCDLADTGLSYGHHRGQREHGLQHHPDVDGHGDDSCGNANSASANQRIDIQDLIAPSFSYLPVDTIECDLWETAPTTTSTASATATDNCELSHVDVSCMPLSACTDDYIVDYTA